jgi:hypothetical protein
MNRSRLAQHSARAVRARGAKRQTACHAGADVNLDAVTWCPEGDLVFVALLKTRKLLILQEAKQAESGENA